MDPVGALEDAHGRLNALAFEVGRLLPAAIAADPDADLREKLAERLAELRDELLEHFADEEEGLFPFIRASFPRETKTVDRLEAAHDTICGSVVRLAHLALRDRVVTSDALLLYERFESAYAIHSREEAALFEELGRALAGEQRLELAAILRALG
jgi:hypothetical protein